MIEFIVREFSISIYDNLQDVVIKIDEQRTYVSFYMFSILNICLS